MKHETYSTEDFPKHPLMFYYEVTQACDLSCKHCRASAQETAAPDELSTELALQLIEQVATFARRPNMVFSGGDPLKRQDLFTLLQHATKRGLSVALTPSATPLATRTAFEKAKAAGVQALGISLDGPTAEIHDAFRGFAGSFSKTVEMLRWAKEIQLPVQINTSITKRNVLLIDAIAQFLTSEDFREAIVMWSVFFLVPIGRGKEESRIIASEYEMVFEKLWHHANDKPFAIKTTEAPHYRRFVLQQGGNPLQSPASQKADSVTSIANMRHRAPLGVRDGRGIMFVSQCGDIFPAGFLPVCCGRFPQDSVVEIYQSHPVFQALQDPNRLKGICGGCEYSDVCGGSRSRAFAVTGDYLAAEPDCCFMG